MWERLHFFQAMLTLTLKSPAVQFKASQNECQLKEDTIRAEKSLET